METISSKTAISLDRIVLRQLDKNDTPAVYGLMRDYATAEKTGFKPMLDKSEAEGFINAHINEGNAFAIGLADDPDNAVGILYLTLKEKDNNGRPCDFAYITYYLREDARGKGYMTESVRGILAYIFTILEMDGACITTYPRNTASRNVAQKCGFVFDRLEKGYGHSGVGILEDIEFWVLTRDDYMKKHPDAGNRVSLDIVTPGRRLSLDWDDDPCLVPFYEGGYAGLKDRNGDVAFPARYESICQWPDSDVVYARSEGLGHYFTTRGERILTDVQELPGADNSIMPYYASEEQHRPDIMKFTVSDMPVEGRCCMMHGRNVNIERVLRKDVKRHFGMGEILPFGKDAFRMFMNEFSYIYAMFEADACGADAPEKCVGKLREVGCYDSSWSYITKICLAEDSIHLRDGEDELVSRIRSFISEDDVRRVAIGVDSTLADDAIRICQLRYFTDRWPCDEELQYFEAVRSGSASEIPVMRNRALSAIRNVARIDLVDDAVEEFLSHNQIPGEIYLSCDADDLERKLRLLFSLGFRKDSALANIVWDFTERLEAWDGKKEFDFGQAAVVLPWLVREGSDPFCRCGGQDVMQMLCGTCSILTDKFPGTSVTAELKKIVDSMKEIVDSRVYCNR